MKKLDSMCLKKKTFTALQAHVVSFKLAILSVNAQLAPVWTVSSESPSEFSLLFFNGHVNTFNSRDEGFQPEEVLVHSVIHRLPRTAATTAAFVQAIEVDGGDV